MTNGTKQLTGVVHGNTIQLDRDAGLPDGQAVSVLISPNLPSSPPGEGLIRSFGGWADADEAELKEFLEQIRRDRKSSRREIEP